MLPNYLCNTRGLALAGSIAGRYGLHAALDNLVANMSKLTMLTSWPTSHAALVFGRSAKAQRAFREVMDVRGNQLGRCV